MTYRRRRKTMETKLQFYKGTDYTQQWQTSSNKKFSIKDELKGFMKGISVKSLAKLAQSSGWMSRLLWISALVAGTVIAVILLCQLVSFYFGHKVTTQVV